MMTPYTPAHAPGMAWAAAWVAWAVVGGMIGDARAQFGPQCEEIKIPMCQTMPYNLTRLPNLLHHSTQENAQLAIDQFELLRWTKCSDQLEFFLCSMYAPICTVGFVNEAIPPCRSVCQAARQGCEPLLAKFDIPWPSNLQCDHLPVYDRGVCITPQAIISSDVTPQPAQEPAPCECRKPRPLRQRVYKRRHFNYVVRGKVRSVETFGSLTLTRMAVTQVVRMGRVQVTPGTDALLWTNRSCACPPLSLNQDYLLLGWEDFANSRLLYLDGSIAVPYRRKHVRKIQNWENMTASQAPSVLPLNTPLSSTLTPTNPSRNVARSQKGKKPTRTNLRRKRLKRKRRRKNRRRRKYNGERRTHNSGR